MSGCGAAVLNFDGSQSASQVITMFRGQAEALMPLIDAVLKKAKSGYDDLDAIVTTAGPGAFTGLRIGISAAKSLGLALDIPVYGITTTQALALAYIEEQSPETPFTAIIETKRSDFYCQSFDIEGKSLSAVRALDGAAVANDVEPICIGDALDRFVEEINAPIERIHGYEMPDPAVIAKVFLTTGAAPDFFFKPAEPVYLRPADVSISKKRQRVIESVK